MDIKSVERDFHDEWAKNENIDKIDVRKNNEVCTAPEMRYITKKLGNLEGKTLLDIGCGWGGMAAYLSNRSDVNVKGITLSEEQIEYAKKRKIEHVEQ